MSTSIQRDEPSIVPNETGSSTQAPTQIGLRARSRHLCSACRQVFGMLDYERYLAHAAERHPGVPLLTRSDFFVQAIERKYGKGGARCC